jgi:hypothetical protein
MRFLLFFLFVVTSSFVSAQENSVKQFQWLEGNWKLDGKEKYEKWQSINDSTIGGISYHYAKEEHDEDETDIFFDESIRLVKRAVNFYYIPKVRGQNDGKEVEFKITSFTAKSFVAENPAHDFPQRIVYTVKDATHLHAYIEGKYNGKTKRIDFRFTKK